MAIIRKLHFVYRQVGGNVKHDSVKINFETEDKSKYAYNLLRYYWLNNEGNFIAKVANLRQEYKMDLNEFNSFIASAKCHIDFGQCYACKLKNLHLVKNRTEASNIFKELHYHYYCIECRIKAEKHCNNLNSYETKTIWMRLSFKYKLWERLEKDELNFLKSVSLLKRDWNRIYHEIISSDFDKYYKILIKLDGMDLINYQKDEDWRNKINLLEDLQNLIRVLA